ncbi:MULTISPECIES: N-acetyltransferase [Micrococcaceae]|uniref:GNAT family N-acetyltransferase n=1 Tax=Micrococcaceae TaxID=1268 RepID=UPI00105B22D6|nr:GNAT family N-acetyltransferase [Arthrobacter sp. JUb115]
MPLELHPLPAEEFHSWMARSTAEYVSDLVAAGSSQHKAQEDADRAMTRAFPTGLPSCTNAVFTLEHGIFGDVGYVWIGHDTSGDPASWWVWDIVVDPGHRGKGFGRQAMNLAEEYARAHGARTLGLNVFGFNQSARGLYESLGYETTSIKMHKSL